MIPMTLRFALKLGAGFKLTKASLTMPPAVKKRRTSDNYSQLHFYIHIIRFRCRCRIQESSFFEGWNWNQERSSAFTSMPNTYEEEASSNKETRK